MEKRKLGKERKGKREEGKSEDREEVMIGWEERRVREKMKKEKMG